MLRCCDTRLLNYDFNRFQPNIDVDWVYHEYAEDQANDGQLSYACNGATVVSNPFTEWSIEAQVPTLDHYKFFLQTVAPVYVLENSTTTVTWEGSAQTFRTSEAPYNCSVVQDEDVRLAYAGYMAADPTTGLNFGFALTNDRVYGIYERQRPLPDQPPAAYAAFTYVIPLKHRRPCDTHRMRLVFAEGAKTVAYHVDGSLKYTLTRVGRLLLCGADMLVQTYGGTEVAVYPAQLILGFGSLTALDWYPACKNANAAGCRFPAIREGLLDLGSAGTCSPVLGCPAPPSFYQLDQLLTIYHIWGQGLTMNVHRLEVTQTACYYE